MSIYLSKKIPESLLKKVSDFIGLQGISFWKKAESEFFQSITPFSVKVEVHENRSYCEPKHLPYMVYHMSDGKKIRDFMKEQEECKDWTTQDLVDHWPEVVYQILHGDENDS